MFVEGGENFIENFVWELVATREVSGGVRNEFLRFFFIEGAGVVNIKNRLVAKKYADLWPRIAGNAGYNVWARWKFFTVHFSFFFYLKDHFFIWNTGLSNLCYKININEPNDLFQITKSAK